MSIAAQVAALEAENARLHERVLILEQRLGLDEPEVAGVEFMISHKLPRQQAETLRLLIAAKGKPISRYAIEAAVTYRDHAADHNPGLADVLICNLRKAVGRDTIQTVRSVGWRIDPNWQPPT